MLITAIQDQHLNCYAHSWTEVILFKYNNFQIPALTSQHTDWKINWVYVVFFTGKNPVASVLVPEQEWQSWGLVTLQCLILHSSQFLNLLQRNSGVTFNHGGPKAFDSSLKVTTVRMQEWTEFSSLKLSPPDSQVCLPRHMLQRGVS